MLPVVKVMREDKGQQTVQTVKRTAVAVAQNNFQFAVVQCSWTIKTIPTKSDDAQAKNLKLKVITRKTLNTMFVLCVSIIFH